MDDWDPKLTNGLAAEHDVILFDYPGIGRSPGETPSTVTAVVSRRWLEFEGGVIS
jgi:pimeloyl-ACP methyl ester carboxylesterase